MISFQWTSKSDANLWISDLDFECTAFAFCILYCQNFWPRMFWSVYSVNPAYLIGCCDCTFINLVIKAIVLIFSPTHKIGCCEYCFWLGWYNTWCVKLASSIFSIAVDGKYFLSCIFFSRAPGTPFVSYYLLLLFSFLSYALFLIFVLYDFCVSIKDGFLNFSLF